MAHAARVTVENPARRKGQKRSSGPMAKKTKRRRARAKKANPTKKRATHRRKRRRTTANPPKRRRSSHRRRAANPSRRRPRRAHARRRHAANPGRFKKRRSSHRRRRNPGSGGSGYLKNAAIAVGAGIGVFLVTQAATYYASSDAQTQDRNQKIIGGAGVALGLYLAKKRPLLGVAIAAGGLLGGFGNFLILQLMRYLPQKAIPKTNGLGAVAYDNLGAVAYDNLGAMRYENLGAIEYEGRGQLAMGEAVYDNMQGWQAMGDPIPPAPWDSENPF